MKCEECKVPISIEEIFIIAPPGSIRPVSRVCEECYCKMSENNDYMSWETSDIPRKRAAMYLANGEIDDTVFEELLEDPELCAEAGRNLLLSGKMLKSMELFERALENKANCAKAIHGMGMILFISGSPKAALSEYERALSMDPENEDIRFDCELLRAAFEDGEESQAEYLSGFYGISGLNGIENH